MKSTRVRQARNPQHPTRHNKNGSGKVIEQVVDEPTPDESLEEYIERVNAEVDEVEGDDHPPRRKWDLEERMDPWLGTN